MRHKLAVFGLFLAIIAGAMFGLAGCGDQATAPLNTQDDGLAALSWVDENGKDPFTQNGGATSAGVKVDADASVVTPRSGGRVELQLETGLSDLFIPPGAVRVPVLVTALAVQVATPFGSVTLYDFGPNGLRFQAPARLTLEVNVPDGSQLSLSWYNPVTKRWEVQESGVVRNGRISFSVRHFSKYGIA